MCRFLLRTIVAFLLFPHLTVFSQESVTQETNASYIKFQQINTPHFRIIYPMGFDTVAQRVANTLETLREPEGKSMGTTPRKISIILQNQSALSNGFVTMAPRRSEFYTMPPQSYNFAANNDWLNLLSSHEYRHMVQFQRSVTGFNKYMSYLFGQQVTAGFAFAAAPQWFWEGDAVATETAFTPGGRGRTPYFDLLFKTNLMEGRVFNYHKQYLRSYKHNIPNHYVLGYNMVTYLREKTGDPMIWEKVTGKSWNVPFIPFAFSNSLRKHTGMYVQDVYREMAAARQKDYEAEIAGLKFTAFESLTRRTTQAYTDYLYPQPLDNGDVVVVKSGIGDIEQLVTIAPDGTEKETFVQGVVNDAGMLSASHQRVVWNEYRYDPRWPVHNYSIVKGYDFGNQREQVVSTHSRYAGATISPDGYQVATVESSHGYKTRLVILDYFSGKEVASFENPNNDIISMPRWADAKSVIFLRMNLQGKTVARFSLDTQTTEDLIPVTQENLGHPVISDNYLLFNSPAGGIDNIYAIDLRNRSRHQVTVSRYGAYNPAVSPDGTWIYYNDQTRNGMDVVRTRWAPETWQPLDKTPQPVKPFYQTLVEQEGQGEILKNVTRNEYESKRYHRASGMINPHSWGPYLVNSLTRINLGVTSQDILSTTRINLGYTFDLNERTGYTNATLSYQGLFPILDVSFIQADRSVNEGDLTIYRIDTTQVAPLILDTTTYERNLKFTWKEKTIEGGLRIPLITTTSKFIGNVSFLNYVGYSQVTSFANNINSSTGRFIPAFERSGPNSPPTQSLTDPGYFFRSYQGNGNLYYNRFGLSAYRLLKQSRRDINSKWGQTIDIDYYTTPYGGNFSGGLFAFTGTGYFPGFFKHHSIWGYWSYQHSQIEQKADNYTFRNQVPLPRGQSVFLFEDFYSMSANYTLPLWYPDIAVGPLLNVQRLRGNVFFDYGYGQTIFTATNGFSQKYTSIGGELKIDFNVMRFLPQFSVMLRYSYGLSPSVTKFEVFLGSFTF